MKRLSSFLFIIFISSQAYASLRSIGNVTTVTRPKTNGVVLNTTSRAKVSIDFFDIDTIRIRVAPNGIFERDFSYAIDYSVDRHTPKTTVSQTALHVTLANFYGVKVVITRAPLAITIVDENN